MLRERADDGADACNGSPGGKRPAERSPAASADARLQENYPQLKSNDQFMRLEDEPMAGTENRIAVARTRYNKAIEDYNVLHPAVPEQHLGRGSQGLPSEARGYYAADATSKEAPKVDFSRK